MTQSTVQGLRSTTPDTTLLTPPEHDPRAAPATTRLRPGELIGDRFLVEGHLGRGAVGVVCRARDLHTDEAVALKVVRGVEERDAVRLVREGQVARRLAHPGIVRSVATGMQGGAPWVAFELVHGARTLAQVAVTLDRPARLRLLLEVSDALAHAHARGVVHRDVKPANVLVDRHGRARIADFGVARPAGAERLTCTGELVGTPVCMAPEQVASRHHEVGPATDVWALGVVLYELLTDALPFPAAHLGELFTRVLDDRPEPPRRLDPTISPALERVVLAALHKDPRRRPADAGAFAAALRRALRTPRRSPTWVLLAAAGAVALVVAARLAPAASPLPGPPAPARARAKASAASPPPREAALPPAPASIPDLAGAVRGLSTALASGDLPPPTRVALRASLQALLDGPCQRDHARSLADPRAIRIDLERDLERGARLLEALIADYPGAGWLRVQRASVRRRRGDERGQLEDLRTAAALAPGLERAWELLGRALAASGDDAGARVAWTEGLAHTPRSARLHFARGVHEQERGRFGPARADYERALALDPRSAAAGFNLALIQANVERDLPGALAALERLSDQLPTHPLVWFHRGRILVELGRSAEALPHLARARALTPADRADLLARLDRVEEEARR